MKVCFPVEQDNGLHSRPYGHFGSAPVFLLCDTDTRETSTVSNQDQGHAHGACNPLGAMGGAQVDALVVGGIGGRAVMGLNNAGIKVYRAADATVGENLDRIQAGTLPEITPADGCRQHGGGGCGH